MRNTKNKLAYLPKDILQTLETYYMSNDKFKDFNEKQINELVNRTVQFYIITLQKWTYLNYILKSKDKSGYEIDITQLDDKGNLNWIFIPSTVFLELYYRPIINNIQLIIKGKTFYTALSELGLLEYKIDKTNSKSNAYKITNKYNISDSGYELIELNKKIPNFNRDKILKRSSLYSEVYNKQVSTFDKVKIKGNIQDIVNDLLKKFREQEKILFSINQLLRIYNKEFSAKVDVTGRFHTTYSRLPSVLFKYLTIGGKSLVEIDVKNCQFLMFSILWNDLSKGSIKYKEITQKGEFYEELIPYAQKIYNDPTIDRNFVKKHISMSVLFKELKELRNCKKAQVINSAFPGIIDFLDNNYRYEKKDELDKMKSGIKKLTNYRKQRETLLETKLLWVALQNLESKLILKNMIKFKEPYLSKHDAIIIQKGNESEILNILRESFSEYNLDFSYEIKNFN